MLFLFSFFFTFFIPPELICANILWKHCKTWHEEFFLYTNYFYAFWLQQNTRLTKIALLWDFGYELLPHFMYQIWAKQSLHATNLKHCGPFILSLQNRENICFLQSRKVHFFIFLFFSTNNMKKIHNFDFCCINRTNSARENNFRFAKSFYFHLVIFVLWAFLRYSSTQIIFFSKIKLLRKLLLFSKY